MCERCAGCVLVLLHVVNVISAFSKCYPVNNQQYCFYTDGSVLSWDDAREFCGRLNSTLPIVTDEDIDNVFQLFISDSNNTNNYVWLDAHAQDVNNDNSAQLHWINGKPSGCIIVQIIDFSIFNLLILIAFICVSVILFSCSAYLQCEKKYPPLRFSDIFPKRLGIF